jgi:hypothetical protein
MPLKVQSKACRKTGTTESSTKLLEDRASLSIGNAVKVQEGLVGVRNTAGNWVRRWCIVLDKGPPLKLHVELPPCAWVVRAFGQAEI